MRFKKNLFYCITGKRWVKLPLGMAKSFFGGGCQKFLYAVSCAEIINEMRYVCMGIVQYLSVCHKHASLQLINNILSTLI